MSPDHTRDIASKPAPPFAHSGKSKLFRISLHYAEPRDVLLCKTGGWA